MAVLLVIVSIIISNFVAVVILESPELPKSPSDMRKEVHPLFVPSLNDAAKALQEGLECTFKDVKVSVEDCPDLTTKPFSLAAKGLGGKPTIVEVGSQYYLTPVPNRAKNYDVKDLTQQTEVDPTLVLGAGAGPSQEIGQSCELIANVFINKGKVHSKTQISKVVKKKHYSKVLPDDVTGYWFTSHLYVSEGAPGKVLKIKAKQRIGEDNFVIAIRDSLRSAFPGKSIGLGGTFLIEGSKSRMHVQGNFSADPLVTDADNFLWLNWYEMDPPLVGVGTILTEDVAGMGLRMFHFHCLSDHNDGGHYYYDLEPDKVEYTAYLNIGTRVVRIDRPQ